jgi:hypothetical protein
VKIGTEDGTKSFLFGVKNRFMSRELAASVLSALGM